MRVVNLTPHSIVIRNEGEIEIQPSGEVARVAMETHETSRIPVRQEGEFFAVRTFLEVPGPVENLPEPQAGTIFIVSRMVLAAVAHRTDVFAPDTGASAFRNAAGQIEAVRGLIGISNNAR